MKYLLLMEVSMVLCMRTKTPLQAPGSNDKPLNGTRPSAIRKSFVYPRGGVFELLTALHKTNKFIICAYSSMESQNLRHAVKQLLSSRPDIKGFDHYLGHWYNIKKHSRTGGGRGYFVRDFEKVWTGPIEELHGFDYTNTVMVDHFQEALAGVYSNSIKVRPCKREELLMRDSSVVDELREVLLGVATKEPFDVRVFLKKLDEDTFKQDTSYTTGRTLERLLSGWEKNHNRKHDSGKNYLEKRWQQKSANGAQYHHQTSSPEATRSASEIQLPSRMFKFSCIKNGQIVLEDETTEVKVKIPLVEVTTSTVISKSMTIKDVENLNMDGVIVEKTLQHQLKRKTA